MSKNLSELEDQLEQILTAVEDLRPIASDGPRTRKQLDSLFRRVHNLKAAASADGLTDLSRAAHELENVLHSLRIGKSTLDDTGLQELTKTSAVLSESLPTYAIPDEIRNSLRAEEKHSLMQSVKEGANLFLVQASFDVANFDRQFQDLKERLSRDGEVISVAPRVESERTEKINFRIIYARAAEASQLQRELADMPDVTLDELLQTMDSIGAVLQRAVRAGQSATVALGKEIEFEVHGADLSLEKSLCDIVAAPLLHMVRNAVDHGIEHTEERNKLGKSPRGTIIIEAARFPGQIRITVTDDGRGIDPLLIETGQLFRPGFSTATKVSEISGRGVGLDAVKTAVEEIGGSVKVISELGKGSTLEISLPAV